MLHLYESEAVVSSNPCSFRVFGVCLCVRLTYADRKLPRPLVILETDANRRADEPKAGQTLVHDGVAVSEVLPDHLAVHNAFWDSAVAS